MRKLLLGFFIFSSVLFSHSFAMDFDSIFVFNDFRLFKPDYMKKDSLEQTPEDFLHRFLGKKQLYNKEDEVDCDQGVIENDLRKEVKMRFVEYDDGRKPHYDSRMPYNDWRKFGGNIYIEPTNYIFDYFSEQAVDEINMILFYNDVIDYGGLIEKYMQRANCLLKKGQYLLITLHDDVAWVYLFEPQIGYIRRVSSGNTVTMWMLESYGNFVEDEFLTMTKDEVKIYFEKRKKIIEKCGCKMHKGRVYFGVVKE